MILRKKSSVTGLLLVLGLAILGAAALPLGVGPARAGFGQVTLPAVRERAVTVKLMQAPQGRRYRIRISAPRGAPPAGGFPILYVLDGDDWFDLTVSLARMHEEQYGPLIVVAVGYPHSAPADGSWRAQDFTSGPPQPHADADWATMPYGGAEAFLDFLTHKLRADLARTYKIDPTRQALFGHSLGGLFVLHVYLEHPKAFDRYIAASPSLWWEQDGLRGKAGALTDSARRPPLLVTSGGFEQELSPEDEALARKLYVHNPSMFEGKSLADALADLRKSQAENKMVDNAKGLASLLRAQGADAQYVVFAGETHGSVPPAALNRGIPFALRPLD